MQRFNNYLAGDKVKAKRSVGSAKEPVMTVVEQTGNKVKVSYGEPGKETVEEHDAEALKYHYEPKEPNGRL